MLKKVFFSFSMVIFLLLSISLLNSAYALSPPDLNQLQIKNTTSDGTVVKSDFIFKKASDGTTYAVKNKTISLRRLTPIARKRLLCGTPASMIVCAVGNKIAYNYFSEELGLRDFNYDADTGTFKKSIPNRYAVSFSAGKPDFTGRFDAPTVQGVLAKHAAMTGKKTDISQEALASIERKVSELEYPSLNFSQGRYSTFGNYFTSGTSFANAIDIVVIDAAVEGVAYQPNGDPVGGGVRHLTPTQLDTMIGTAIADAPLPIIEDLLTSPDYVAEEHDVLADLALEAKPYDPVTDDYIGTGEGVGEGEGTDTGTGEGTDTGTGSAFRLPAFCSWASSVCDFIDSFKSEVPEELPPQSVPFGSLSDVGLDGVDRYEQRINFSGQCPSSSFDLNVMGVQISKPIPYHHFCDFLTMIAPWLLAMTYIGTAYFVVENI